MSRPLVERGAERFRERDSRPHTEVRLGVDHLAVNVTRERSPHRKFHHRMVPILGHCSLRMGHPKLSASLHPQTRRD